MIEKLPVNRPGKTLKALNLKHRARAVLPDFVVSAILIACLGILGSDAHALALGRISVLSALGEPLRAEIDVPDINPDEVASLRASIGSVEAFRRAGLEYSNLLSGVQVTLQRKADGHAFLGLSGDRIINEPYLDLVVETSWATGRLVRDYTLLFDPPSNRQTAPVGVTASVTSRSIPALPAPANTSPSQVVPSTATAAVSTPRPTSGTQAAPSRKALPSKQITTEDAKRVTVRAGDTASKIATAFKPASVSLDQMLVALLRENPEAFDGNVNRLKAGAVLNVPTLEQAGATLEAEARQTVEAQSRDFNDFRRKFAEGVHAVNGDASQRVAVGKVQAKIEDKKIVSPTPDKLRLQKGELLGKASQEKLAAELQAAETSKRLSELNKNIADLKNLAPATAVASGTTALESARNSATPSSSQSLPSVPLAVPSAPAIATPVSVASAPSQAASSAAAINATAVASAQVDAAQSKAQSTALAASATSAPPVNATPASGIPSVAPDLLSELLENPVIPATAGGLIALLAGLGFYRTQQRKKANHVDSSFMESRLQPDSFFDASGGQKIDTDEAVLAEGSSLVYSQSQMGVGSDVDPVAEADVYLAYGRDLQAEEILKEALRVNPSRAAIHFKLLQIFAKRHDVKGYAVTAANAFKLTGGLGSDWTQACEAGRAIDPTNPLYHADGVQIFSGPVSEPLPILESAGSSTVEINELPALSTSAVDLDLDLDFSAPAPSFQLGDEPTVALRVETPVQTHEYEQTAPSSAALIDTVALRSLGFETPEADDLPMEPTQTLSFSTTEMLDLSSPDPRHELKPSSNGGMLEFDLDSLSLDLEASSSPEKVDTSTAESDDGLDGEDPLTTKLALAEEFQAIGDDDGARALAQEVVEAAAGNLKAKAQRFLAELG